MQAGRFYTRNLVGGAILALVAGVVFAGGGRADTVARVTMTNQLRFEPASVTIEAGDAVMFDNTSMLMHTVTADPDEATIAGSVRLPEGARPFDSGRLKPGQTFRHTFTTPGHYSYFCQPHEGAKMRGEIIVRP